MKGAKNGNCNVTACQQPGAVYFNKSTKAYYCKSCADEINWPGGRLDTMKLYGVPMLCELSHEVSKCKHCHEHYDNTDINEMIKCIAANHHEPIS